MTVLLEVAVDSIEGVAAAREGGADRIELCASLGEGGLTPSTGTLALALRVGLPLMVMIRPRGGGFVYSARELGVMEEDIHVLKDRGAAGFVFGVLTPRGEIDRSALERLFTAARPLPITFHRAFDQSRDLQESLEVLVSFGIERVLSSGGARNVDRGLPTLIRLAEVAAGRIQLLPGGGVTATNAQSLARELRAKELHLSATTWLPEAWIGLPLAPDFSLPGAPRSHHLRATNVAAIRAVRAAVQDS